MTNSLDPDEVAHHEPPHLDGSTLFANSTIFIFGSISVITTDLAYLIKAKFLRDLNLLS